MTSYPYSYDDLLYRLHNAKSVDDIYTKINLPQPKISRKNRLSIFANFGAFVEKLNRCPEHISSYFKAETGACNSINKQNQLLIQGILNDTKCETIVRNYIKEFVMCPQCKCLNTLLTKEKGLTYLVCNQCSAKTSMGKI